MVNVYMFFNSIIIFNIAIIIAKYYIVCFACFCFKFTIEIICIFIIVIIIILNFFTISIKNSYIRVVIFIIATVIRNNCIPATFCWCKFNNNFSIFFRNINCICFVCFNFFIFYIKLTNITFFVKIFICMTTHFTTTIANAVIPIVFIYRWNYFACQVIFTSITVIACCVTVSTSSFSAFFNIT